MQRRRKSQWTSDHPRVRGEKYELCACNDFDLGSPPRARGEEHCKASRDGQGRITPACAGRRKGEEIKAWLAGDHPRVRGEKLWINAGYDTLMGSPPRVRGEGGRKLRGFGMTRITPACAGRRKCTRKKVAR